jgi:hypothetical protein
MPKKYCDWREDEEQFGGRARPNGYLGIIHSLLPSSTDGRAHEAGPSGSSNYCPGPLGHISIIGNYRFCVSHAYNCGGN